MELTLSNFLSLQTETEERGGTVLHMWHSFSQHENVEEARQIVSCKIHYAGAQKYVAKRYLTILIRCVCFVDVCLHFLPGYV